MYDTISTTGELRWKNTQTHLDYFSSCLKIDQTNKQKWPRHYDGQIPS